MNQFVLFGSTHIITIVVVCVAGYLIPLFISKGSLHLQEKIAKVLGFLIIIHKLIAEPLCWYFIFGAPWQLVLPLHMCQLSVLILGIYLFFGRKKILFEISYYWGFLGVLAALLTPDLQYSFPDPKFIIFFAEHCLIMILLFYIILVYKERVYLHSTWTICKYTIAISFVILGINYIVGAPANYWYLALRLNTRTVLDLFPDPPYHIPLLAIALCICFYILYLPYWIKDHFNAKSSA